MTVVSAASRCLLPFLFLVSCSSSKKEPEPALSDLTALSCPRPGALPFRTEARAFQTTSSKETATGNPRSKDEASDTVGNPGGSIANTGSENDAPAAGEPRYIGRKARTGENAGLAATALAGEPISLWTYGDSGWRSLGRTTTDNDGRYALDPGEMAVANGNPVYSILEGDGSCAEHYDFLLPAGSKVVVTDIDGTLTDSDTEILKQAADGSYSPLQKTGAQAAMKAWADKGYLVVYLTARSHTYRTETRGWLRDQGFPLGPVFTASSPASGDAAVQYKGAWCTRLAQSFGWEVVAAYGDMLTDFQAYDKAGISKGKTFSIGPNAGAMDTVSLGNDYTPHIASFIQKQPDNR